MSRLDRIDLAFIAFIVIVLLAVAGIVPALVVYQSGERARAEEACARAFTPDQCTVLLYRE